MIFLYTCFQYKLFITWRTTATITINIWNVCLWIANSKRHRSIRFLSHFCFTHTHTRTQIISIYETKTIISKYIYLYDWWSFQIISSLRGQNIFFFFESLWCHFIMNMIYDDIFWPIINDFYSNPSKYIHINEWKKK